MILFLFTLENMFFSFTRYNVWDKCSRFVPIPKDLFFPCERETLLHEKHYILKAHIPLETFNIYLQHILSGKVYMNQCGKCARYHDIG